MLLDRLIVAIADPTDGKQFLNLLCSQRLKSLLHDCIVLSKPNPRDVVEGCCPALVDYSNDANPKQETWRLDRGSWNSVEKGT